MVHLSRLAVALALGGLFCGPLAADVVPTRYASESGAKETVQARLAASGVDADLAKARVKRLTDDEAAFFAADAQRVQIVGQEMWGGQSDNLWWEWLFGIGALVGVGIGYYFFAIDNDD
jgi:hypothetical protein